MNAIKIDGRQTLKYVSKNFQNNREIVMFAVENNASTFEFVSENLQNDKDFILSCFSFVPNIITIFSDDEDTKNFLLEITTAI
jgi:hypothetical protein